MSRSDTVAPTLPTWTSFSALWAAAMRAARGKRHRGTVARTLVDLEPTLLSLQAALREGRWHPGQSTTQHVRDPKPRLIHVAPFVDRIVHQALCEAIGPVLDRHLIEHSYACRQGRGTHATVDQARRWARSHRFYLHLDVRKLFPTIDHALLVRQLGRAAMCPETLEVCRRIIAAHPSDPSAPRFHFEGDDLLAPLERRIGLPIGNLTSQHFAGRYLSPVDHAVKEGQRLRAYLRYMDDMLCFHDDRSRLVEVGRAAERAAARLRLRLHPWEVRPTRTGVPFLGFVIGPDAVRVRRSTVRRARRRLRRLVDEGDPEALHRSLTSTLAHLKHGDTYRLRTELLRELGLLHGDDEY